MSAFQEKARSSCYCILLWPTFQRSNSETRHWYHAKRIFRLPAEDVLFFLSENAPLDGDIMTSNEIVERLSDETESTVRKTGYALCCYSSVEKSYFGKYTTE